MATKKLKVVELFAGVGGFRIGLEKAKNYEVVWSNQWEPMTKTQHASDIYEARFGHKGHSNIDIEEIELDFIDFGVEEVFHDEDGILLYAPFENFGKIQKELEKRDLGIISSDIERIPKQTRKLDTDCYEEVIKLIEKIEDDDDVQNVYHNLEMLNN